MKRIVLLFIVISMLICLFACDASDKEAKNITDNYADQLDADSLDAGNTNAANVSDSSCDPHDDYDWSRQYIQFENFDEYVDWYRSGKYKSDFYVDKEGNKSDKLLKLGKELHQGERYLYKPYYYGKEPNGTTTVILASGYNVKHRYLFLPENAQKDDSEGKLHCEVYLKYLSDEYRGTSDVVSAYESVVGIGTAKNTVMDKKKVIFDEKERAVLTNSRTYESGYTEITKSFVWEDVLITILHDKDLGFDLQDFLDGFELRPIDLTTLSTAEKE